MHFILTPCARAVMCAGVVAIVASCFSVVSAAAACGGMPTVVIGQPVYCTTPGDDWVEVPAGTNTAYVIVTGAGGGSSTPVINSGADFYGAGGVSRNMTATIVFPPETKYLQVTVGATGTKSPGTYSAATGGNASSIAALDASGGYLGMILMAGGGGGGGVGFRTQSSAAPIGGGSDNFDGSRTADTTVAPAGYGNNVLRNIRPLFSTGFAGSPDSNGLGGVPATVMPIAPTVYGLNRSRLYLEGDPDGLYLIQGHPGASAFDMTNGQIAPGGEHIVFNDTHCSGGGGHGWGGGASGSVVVLVNTSSCAGGGGGGGGSYSNASMVTTKTSYAVWTGWPAGTPGTKDSDGFAYIKFLNPSASPSSSRTPTPSSSLSKSPSVEASSTRSSTASASVSPSWSVSLSSSASSSVSGSVAPTPVTPSATGSSTASTSATASSSVSPASPSVSASATTSPSVSSSTAASGSASGSWSVSTTATASASLSASGSPSATRTASATSSVSGSFSGSPSASVSGTLSASSSTSPTGTASTSETLSSTASRTASSSIAPTVSVSASLSGSRTVSASVSASKLPSPSVSASETRSPSRSATHTSSPTHTQSISPSSSVSATASETASITASTTSSPSVSSSATSSASPSSSRSSARSRTSSRSVSPSTSASVSTAWSPSASPSPPVVVSLELSLLGGSFDTLASGAAAQLRSGLEAMAAEAGADAADATITSITVDTATMPNSQLQAIASGAASAADIVSAASAAGALVNGTRQIVNASDPRINGDVVIIEEQPSEDANRRRALRLEVAARSLLASGGLLSYPAGANCTPVDIYQPGSSTVSITNVVTRLLLPASFLASIGGDPAASGAAVRARLLRYLSNSTLVTKTLGSFFRLWANCTGVPTSTTGDVFARIAATVSLPPSPPQPPLPSKAGATVGIVIGCVAAAALLITLAICWHARLSVGASWCCCFPCCPCCLVCCRRKRKKDEDEEECRRQERLREQAKLAVARMLKEQEPEAYPSRSGSGSPANASVSAGCRHPVAQVREPSVLPYVAAPKVGAALRDHHDVDVAVVASSRRPGAIVVV